jgi:hypothetical protein
MKGEKVDKKEFKKILGIIKDFPNVRIGHFCDSGVEVAKLIEEYSKDRDMEYILNVTNRDFYEKIKDEFPKSRFFNLKRPKYFLNGKFYDYLFVESKIDSSEREEFLKKCHSTIKNSGLILIFTKNRDYQNIDEWSRLLEENYYVATSVIDIDEKNSIIISRKMHGWGG